MRVVKQSDTFVRYESHKVFINVYHGRASYELGVEIGKVEQPNAFLTLPDLTEDYIPGFQTSTAEGIRESVPKLANLVVVHAQPFLRGDSEAFAHARRLQSARAARLMESMKLEDVRSKAEKAWHSKDFSEVVRLYSAISDRLNSVEIKKLVYSKKKLGIAVCPN